MGFLRNSSCVSTYVKLHHLDSNETLWGENLDKNYTICMCCFEQILETSSHKKQQYAPPTSHLTNDLIKTKKAYWTLLEKQGPTHKRCSPMNTQVLADHQLCADTGYSQEHLAGIMNDKDVWRESESHRIPCYQHLIIYTYIHTHTLSLSLSLSLSHTHTHTHIISF